MKREWNCVDLSPDEADIFRRFLRDEEIAYETSGKWNKVHFEVFVNEREEDECNRLLSGF